MTAASGAWSGFLPREWAIAVVGALAVQVATVATFFVAQGRAQLVMPEVDKGLEVPVRVIPVLDLDAPLLKLGGKRDPARLPDRWVRQAPVQRVEQKAVATTKASKSAADIPEPDLKIASAAPPPSASVAKQVDLESPTADAKPEANVDQEGVADGVAEGTETDPLKGRAVDLYRARLASWFSSKFSVSGSGMSTEELTKYRVSVTVEISADRQVQGYSMSPSGNGIFDAAAKRTMESTKGLTLPPPPDNYPDIVQSKIQVTFVCKEGRCD